MGGEPLADVSEDFLALRLINGMTFAFEDLALVRHFIAVEHFFQRLRLRRAHSVVGAAMHHKKRRANLLSRSDRRRGKTVARSDTAAGDRGRLERVRRSGGEPDGDESTHAVAVRRDAL